MGGEEGMRVGSCYGFNFRIRTTHRAGPLNTFLPDVTPKTEKKRFNINLAQAQKIQAFRGLHYLTRGYNRGRLNLEACNEATVRLCDCLLDKNCDYLQDTGKDPGPITEKNCEHTAPTLDELYRNWNTKYQHYRMIDCRPKTTPGRDAEHV